MRRTMSALLALCVIAGSFAGLGCQKQQAGDTSYYEPPAPAPAPKPRPGKRPAGYGEDLPGYGGGGPAPGGYRGGSGPAPGAYGDGGSSRVD